MSTHNRHLRQFSRFLQAHQCSQHTDATPLVISSTATGRMHATNATRMSLIQVVEGQLTRAAEAPEKWAGQTVRLVREHQSPRTTLKAKGRSSRVERAKNIGTCVLKGREHGP